MSIRTRRVGKEIRRIISEMIEMQELHDPRLHGMISITDVDVAPDLKSAKVYYSCYGNSEDRESTGEAFESAKGFIQSKVGTILQVRFTPVLSFFEDSSMEYGEQIESAIENLDQDEH